MSNPDLPKIADMETSKPPSIDLFFKTRTSQSETTARDSCPEAQAGGGGQAGHAGKTRTRLWEGFS